MNMKCASDISVSALEVEGRRPVLFLAHLSSFGQCTVSTRISLTSLEGVSGAEIWDTVGGLLLDTVYPYG